jgi:hypothetical protein
VVQGSDVNQLDRGAPGDDGVGGGAAGSRGCVARAQGERRAQALPARGQQVSGDVAEQAVVGADRVVETSLDAYEVGGERRESDVVDQGHRHGSFVEVRPGALTSAQIFGLEATAAVGRGSIRDGWE